MMAKQMTPEEWAEWDAGYDERTRLIMQRLAYHRARIAEERTAAEARAERRRRLKRLFSLGLLGAH